ncbi:MAG: type III-A CRISPR-associated protein Csm2 [Chthonomonadetes bacterium]|nr:type III-A CRISPR-associated protein Csm2 [Chthonomonadetes bacterium]
MATQGKSDIDTVIERIRSLQRMSDLRVEEFAVEDGLADQVVKAVGTSQLKPTQLRKVFHTLKGIQQRVKQAPEPDPFNSAELLKLMPVLAYAVGRDLIPRDFYRLLKEVFEPKRLRTNADFLRAFDFVEAILAYHKYRGGK